MGDIVCVCVCPDLPYPGSNSSGESDTLGSEGYREKASSDKTRLADIPTHVNESISISDMDREATDIEVGHGTGSISIIHIIHLTFF